MTPSGAQRLRSGLIFGGTTVSVFAALWGLLDPAGGFDSVDRTFSRRTIDYVLLALTSVLAAAVVTAMQRLLSDEEVESDASRTAEGASRVELNVAADISRAVHSVTAVGLSLPSFANEQALRAYGSLVARGVFVRLLLVNPMSPVLLQRPRGLYAAHDPPSVTAATSLRCLLGYRDQLGPALQERFRIFVSNLLPPVGAQIVDDEIVWYPYLASTTGVTAPYFRADARHSMGRSVAEHCQLLIREHAIECTVVDGQALAEAVRVDPMISSQLPASEARAVRRALGVR